MHKTSACRVGISQCKKKKMKKNIFDLMHTDYVTSAFFYGHLLYFM